MPRRKRHAIEKEKTAPRIFAPAANPESRENQLISLATNEAEKRIRDGSASDTLLSHFLRLGTQKEKLEKEILEKQKNLLDAKTESIKSTKRFEEIYQKALESMKICRGDGDSGEDEYL